MISATKLRDILKNSTSVPLQNLLNLWAIDDNIIIGTDYSMTAFFAVTPSDLIHTEDREVAMVFSALKNTLQGIEQTATIQFYITTSLGDEETIKAFEECSELNTDISQYIKKSKVDKIRSGFLKNRKYYMSLTVGKDKNSEQKKEVNAFKVLHGTTAKAIPEMDREIRQRLESLIDEMIPGLETAKIHFHRMDEDEIVKYIYDYLNPSRQQMLSPPKLRQAVTARSQLLFNAAENNFDSAYVDGFYHRAVNLYVRPEEVSFYDIIRFLEEMLPEHTAVVTLETGDQDAFAKEVRFTGTVANNISSLSVFQRNMDAAMVGNAADNLLDETKETFQKLFKYSLCVIFKDRKLEHLTSKTNAAVRAMRRIGDAEGIIDDMNHLNLFLTAIPGHSHLNFQKHVFNSAMIAQLLPVSAPWKGSKKPEIIFKTDNAELLPIDLFDPSLPAKHGLIVGSTGKGKSFTTNYVLSNFFLQSEDNHIVIVDVGGSYRKIARNFGGEYLEIELGDKYSFNPFPATDEAVIDDSEEHYDIDPDVVSYITLLVRKMLALESLSGQENMIFEKAIKNTYRYTKTDPPLLGALRYQLMNFEGDDDDKLIARNFGKNLEQWTEGTYGKLVNRENSITPTSRLIVFDLLKLDDQPDLQSIIFFLIKSVLSKKLKNTALRKIIVIDEGWKFFSDPVGAELIQNLYRTARKYNAAIFSISQSPVDFLSTPAANAIISNSYVKYILGLKSGHELLPQFGINSQEIESVESLIMKKGRFSEVFLKFNDNSRVIRIEPSRAEYWLCTTDADDLTKENNLRAQFPEAGEFEILKRLAEGGAK